MKKRLKVEVNSEIKEVLRSKSISLHDGIGYLICLHFGVNPSYIPEDLKRKVLASGIISKDYSSNTFIWKIGLFEETQTGFEWISDWMDLFKAVNPDRRGAKSQVLKRMKTFFANNPTIRKEDVFEATKYYLGSLNDPRYCKSAHKFIREQDGTSLLLDHIERIYDLRESTDKFNENVI